MKTETLSTAVVATPPASYTGLVLMGYPVADWVSLCMLVYAVLLIIAQAPKAWASLRTALKGAQDE